ncbi:MAG TPA: alcohol dehydrogenase catalytic domain-containing protein [Actinoplanes sp.]|nr:alcohol dehydrogenase catalytic domain-containing protein [Actinoplanes sp.]
MRALQFSGGSVAEVIDLEPPPLRPAWARVRVSFVSVCGSDLWLYRGQWHGNKYPIVPGHEWSGTVAEVNGPQQEWIGRRVIGDLIDACGTCGPCRDRLPVMCENLTEIGFSVNGGCAEYVDVPVANLYALPDNLSTAAACQAEPLSVALHALDRAALRSAERVAVLGCGGIGLLILQAARHAGAEVSLAADPVEYRRGVAGRLGAAETADGSSKAYDGIGRAGLDVVFEASGDPESVNHALGLIRPGGRVISVGYQVGATTPIETAKLPLTYGSLLGVMGPGNMYRHAVRLLASGAVVAEPLLTDFVKLDDHQSALAGAIDRKPGTIRVVFELRGEDRE